MAVLIVLGLTASLHACKHAALSSAKGRSLSDIAAAMKSAPVRRAMLYQDSEGWHQLEVTMGSVNALTKAKQNLFDFYKAGPAAMLADPAGTLTQYDVKASADTLFTAFSAPFDISTDTRGLIFPPEVAAMRQQLIDLGTQLQSADAAALASPALSSRSVLLALDHYIFALYLGGRTNPLGFAWRCKGTLDFPLTPEYGSLVLDSLKLIDELRVSAAQGKPNEDRDRLTVLQSLLSVKQTIAYLDAEPPHASTTADSVFWSEVQAQEGWLIKKLAFPTPGDPKIEIWSATYDPDPTKPSSYEKFMLNMAPDAASVPSPADLMKYLQGTFEQSSISGTVAQDHTWWQFPMMPSSSGEVGLMLYNPPGSKRTLYVDDYAGVLARALTYVNTANADSNGMFDALAAYLTQAQANYTQATAPMEIDVARPAPSEDLDAIMESALPPSTIPTDQSQSRSPSVSDPSVRTGSPSPNSVVPAAQDTSSGDDSNRGARP